MIFDKEDFGDIVQELSDLLDSLGRGEKSKETREIPMDDVGLH